MPSEQRGQSTVEFALVLPLVVLLLLGLLQAGVMLRDQMMVVSAAREAARAAAVSADPSRINSAAEAVAPGLDISVATSRGPKRGDQVKVEISAEPTRLPLVGLLVQGRTLRASATMRVERDS